MKPGNRPPFPLPLLRFWGLRILPLWFLVAGMIFLIQIAICGIAHDNELIKNLFTYIDGFPSFVKAAFGVEVLQQGGISTFIAFGYRHPLILLLFMLFAVGVPTRLLAGEVQQGEMELILSRSITKTQVYICASALTLVGMFALVLVMFFSTFIATRIYAFEKAVPLYPFFIMAMNGGVLASAVAAISLLAAASFRRRGTAVGLTTTYLVISYFVSIVAAWWSPMKLLGPLTPFWYVNNSRIFSNTSWPVSDMIVLAVILIVAAVAGGIIWQRRDLPL
jgi:beta-exotoxin I transport system permease protein